MQSKTTLLTLCVVLVCSLPARTRAEEEAAGPNPDRIKAIFELGRLYGELRALNEVLLYEMKLVADQKDTDGVREVFARKEREYESRFAKLIELAVAAPDTALARDAAILTLNTTYGSERETAIDLLLNYHIKSHRLDEAVTCLGYTSRSTEICRRVLSENDDASVRAHARFQIAYKNWRSSDEARRQAKADLWSIVQTGEEITFHDGGTWGPNQTKKSLSFVASSARPQGPDSARPDPRRQR